MSHINLVSIDWLYWQTVEVRDFMYISDEDSLLLLRKKLGFGAGKINGPGGRIERSETPLD